MQQILESRPHPEQGYRSCLGLLRLAKHYGPARLNAACDRARVAGARSYRHVDSMLKHGLDRQPLLIDDGADHRPAPIHRQRPRSRVLPRRRALMMTTTLDRLRDLRLGAMADAYLAAAPGRRPCPPSASTSASACSSMPSISFATTARSRAG